MMLLSRFSLASSLLALAAAQNVHEKLSFNPNYAGIQHHGNKIDNWISSGSDHELEIYRDRVVITPQGAGNKRGIIWTEGTSPSQYFTVDFWFRANGPEHGTGNLQLWYVKDLPKNPQDASIYSVGTFDGLVLVIDQYQGGSLRAFLNDGTVNYKQHHGIDGLYFAHCDFHYRNLGRWSSISVKATPEIFEVGIDGRICFTYDRIHLTAGNHFGVSSSTGENPDSFEISSFRVSEVESHEAPDFSHHGESLPPTGEHEHVEHHHYDDSNFVSDAPHDAAAADFVSTGDQFADLHNRLQAIQHQINILFNEFSAQNKMLEERIHGIPFIARHIQEVEHVAKTARDTIQELHGDKTIKELQQSLREVHEDLRRAHDTLNVLPHHVTGSKYFN